LADLPVPLYYPYVAAQYHKMYITGDISEGGKPTADIKMYDNSKKSWKKIGSLSSARTYVAVAAVYNNAIVVIGGCTKAGGNAESSSLAIVELGQAELLH